MAHENGMNGCRAQPSNDHSMRTWIDGWTHRDALGDALPHRSARINRARSARMRV